MNRLMTLAALLCAMLLTSCAITRPTVTKVTDSYFMVAYPLQYRTLDSKYVIEVPVGFLTDLTSIPRGLWWWESPIDRSMAPAIVHDYLYWDQSCSKEEADVVLLLAMKETGVSSAKRLAIFVGVDKAGWSSWNRNKAARDAGETRLLSESYARTVLDSGIDPRATLETIYADAKKRNGLVHPAIPNASVRAACSAAMSHYRTLQSL